MKTHPPSADNPRKGLVLAACGRPLFLLPAWLCAASGAALSQGTLPPVIPLIIVTAAFSLVLGAIHAANLIADRHTDQINRKNSFWVGRLPATIIARHAAGWAILGLLLSAWAHVYFVIPMILALVLGFGFSLPPARLSAHGGLDVVSIILGYGVLAPWWGAMVSHWDPSVSSPAMGIPLQAVALLAPLVAIVFFLKTILNVKGDRSTGKNTLAVHMNFTGELHRPLLVSSALAGIAAAGIPGFLAYPSVAIGAVVWLLLSSILTHMVRKQES